MTTAVNCAHSTYMGYRTMRCLDGTLPAMPFARCRCGWEGPSRLSRSDAVRDGMGHLETEGITIKGDGDDENTNDS